MTRQEKYDKIVERLSSTDNYDKRPNAIWTQEEIEISKQREQLKKYLDDIQRTSGDKREICEYNFDVLYRALSTQLDELGWK